MLPTLLCIVALVAGLAGVVMSPKIWQRTVALLVIGIIVFFMTQSAIVMGRKDLAAWHYGRNIRPTEKLWSLLRAEMDAEQYDQAKAELVTITTNWSRIGAWPKSYSAADVLEGIEREKQANHGTEPIR